MVIYFEADSIINHPFNSNWISLYERNGNFKTCLATTFQYLSKSDQSNHKLKYFI